MRALYCALMIVLSRGVAISLGEEPLPIPPAQPLEYRTFPGASIGWRDIERIGARLTAETLVQIRLRITRRALAPMVALDACSESHTGTTSSANEASFSWTHTPANDPRGVVVFAARYGANSAAASSVSYGQTAVPAVEGGSAIDTSGEPMRMQAFFLGADVPTGAQTVTVTRSNNADNMYAVACTVTANGNTTVAGVTLLEGDGELTEQLVDDGLTSGVSLRFAAVQSGENSASNVVGGANSTSQHSIAPGNRVVRVLTETTGGFGSRPVGAVWATADDRAAVFLAIVSDASDAAESQQGAGGAQNVVAAASCSQADIQTAIDTAASGATIEVPEGECIWTGQLTSQGKSLSIRGQGDGPVITDANSADTRVMRFDCPTGGYLEFSNFYFVEGLDTNEENHPLLIVNGCDHFRVIGNTFDGYSGGERSEIIHFDNSFGVFAGNYFKNGGATNLILVGHTKFKGVGQYGDNSWAQPTNWGSPDAVYIEDNIFENLSNQAFQIVEANGEGARYVFRRNVVRHYFIGGHGTESPGRPRSVRSIEAYQNEWQVNASPATLDRMAQARGGTVLMWGNSVSRIGGGAPPFNSWLRAWQARLTDSLGGWGYCDGTGPFDHNDTTGGPNGDGIYVSGTATAGTTTDSLVDATKDFTAACNGGSCVGYSLIDKTRNRSSLITGAKGDTITTRATNFNVPHNYQEGDEYEIRRVIRCLDHVASGQGALLSGDFGSITPGGPVMNESDPLYVWDNTGGTPTFSVVSNLARLVQNVDFYVGTSSFDGGAGVGSGPRAERPKTCTPFVAYWSTDGGSNWDLTNESEHDGALDRCVDTDTWANDWYIPYTYPHPDRANWPPQN